MLLIGPWGGILEQVSFAPITARPLEPAEVAAAAALAVANGVQGVYVRNVLHAHPRLGSKARFLAFHGGASLLGLAYFGPRGNLLVLEAEPGVLDPQAAAGAIVAARHPWRIVLGPRALVAAILAQGRYSTLVDREQVYYGADRGVLADLVARADASAGSSGEASEAAPAAVPGRWRCASPTERIWTP